jgi:hypothetical protein
MVTISRLAKENTAALSKSAHTIYYFRMVAKILGSGLPGPSIASSGGLLRLAESLASQPAKESVVEMVEIGSGTLPL